MTLRAPATAILVVCLGGCGHSDAQLEAKRDDWLLSPAADLDPAAHGVEIELEARKAALELAPGRKTQLATYSGLLPGPLIRAKRGDTLRVRFRNLLDAPTSVHWHGVRLPNAMDGVPGMTQAAVAPSASFDYEFALPDAGLYWYHPHHDSVAGLGAGLYGAVLVEDPAEPAGLGEEVVLILSDVSVDAEGQLLPPGKDWDSMLVGNEGAVLLVNGHVYPTLKVKPGRRQRWRVLNAARSRYFKLGLPGHRFLQIGGDGGLAESPLEIEAPVIVPGERLDLLVTPTGEDGMALDVKALPLSRGLPLPLSQEKALFRLEFEGAPEATAPLPHLMPEPLRIDVSSAERIQIALTMTETDGMVQMGINDRPFADSTPIHARVGSNQTFLVQNKSVYSHPFHLHGFFFQLLAADGTPLHPSLAKDTVEIPARAEQLLTVQYDDRPGMWMFHCHILDHADAGMMGMIHLER